MATSHGEAVGRRPEPRWMTLADLCVMVAGVALWMTIPSRASGWPLFLAPPPLMFFACGRSPTGPRDSAWCSPWSCSSGAGSTGARSGPPSGSRSGSRRSACSRRCLTSTRRSTPTTPPWAPLALDFGVAALAAVRAGGRGRRPGRGWVGPPPASGARRVAGRIGAVGRRDRGLGCCSGSGGRARSPAWNCRRLLVPGPGGDPSSWGWRGPVVFAALRDVVGERAHRPHLGPPGRRHGAGLAGRPPPRRGPSPGLDRVGRRRHRLMAVCAHGARRDAARPHRTGIVGGGCRGWCRGGSPASSASDATRALRGHWPLTTCRRSSPRILDGSRARCCDRAARACRRSS